MVTLDHQSWLLWRHRSGRKQPVAAESSWSGKSSACSVTTDPDDSSTTTGFLQRMDDHVQETWDCAKAAMVGAERLLRYHELPKEWQENEYVLSG